MWYQRYLEWRERYLWPTTVTAGVLILGLFVLAQIFGAMEGLLLERQFLNFAILLLLLDVGQLLVRVAQSTSDLQRLLVGVAQSISGASAIRVSPDQHTDSPRIEEDVKRLRPKNADLLEYSSDTVRSLIKTLRNQGCEIRILLRDPSSVNGVLQQTRICNRLRSLLTPPRPGSKPVPKIKVRCYSRDASVRGRKLGDDLINIGWYIPDLWDEKKEIVGHENPLITADAMSPEGRQLAAWFDNYFDKLWREATSAKKALGSYEELVARVKPSRRRPGRVTVKDRRQ